MNRKPSAGAEFKRVMEMPTGMEDEDRNVAQATSALFFIATLVQVFYKLVLLVISLFTFPMEVMIRRNFGERYLTFPRIAVGFLFLGTYSVVIGSLTGGTRGAAVTAMSFFTIVYIIRCLMHAIAVQKRKKSKQVCHSRYCGDSLGFWQILPGYEKAGQYGVQRSWEPAVLIGIGTLLFFITRSWGIFFLMSGLALFLKHYAIHREFRRHLLDTIDRRIEGEQLEKAMTEWTDPSDLKTDGFVLPTFVRDQEPKERVDFLKSMGAMNPQLKALYDESVHGPAEEGDDDLLDDAFDDEEAFVEDGPDEVEDSEEATEGDRQEEESETEVVESDVVADEPGMEVADAAIIDGSVESVDPQEPPDEAEPPVKPSAS